MNTVNEPLTPVPVYVESESDAAIVTLVKIDASTGMSRLMRESMVALLGVNAPASLLDVQTRASAARLKIVR